MCSNFYRPSLRWLLIRCAVSDVLFTDTPLGVRWPLRISALSQLSLRVGVQAKVDDDQSLHAFVGVLKV